MKVVIFADSLALPRPESEGNIPHEATYPYLLDRSLRDRLGPDAPMVIERGMRRRTIEYVLDEWLEMVELRSPEIVVIHVGIVDCAPRIFLRRERQFVERLRPARLRKGILSFVHKHRPRIIRARPRVYVPVDRFRRSVEETISRARQHGVRRLILVNIITPPPEMDLRSPGFVRNVETYNAVLASCAASENVHLIDLNNLVATNGGVGKLTTDGIHINPLGHQMLARELESQVMSLISENMVAAGSKQHWGGSH